MVKERHLGHHIWEWSVMKEKKKKKESLIEIKYLNTHKTVSAKTTHVYI